MHPSGQWSLTGSAYACRRVIRCRTRNQLCGICDWPFPEIENSGREVLPKFASMRAGHNMGAKALQAKGVIRQRLNLGSKWLLGATTPRPMWCLTRALKSRSC
ncbi:unnamed protein product [Dibothriocephalus latus]|uniref:Uncharacterized protein n=1 Tax=Dibothriocephalus latus TaxID=60516 RepID=A0A3P7LAT4_DIBLA|nr:unnamed protein product [Dibothriocephalus latus]